MKYLIILFGVFIVVTALIMLIRPALFLDHMQRYSHTASMHAMAVVVRVILGIALILYAEHSKFPLVFEIIGWLSVIAAAIFAVIPHKRFTNLINWVVKRFTPYARVGASVGILFGAFLIYAVF